MWVEQIWRYPVKSMAGEPLEVAELELGGIVGDRVVHVQSADGRVVTSRRQPRLLGHRAALGEDGEPRIDGRPWASADVAADVRRAAGEGTRLVRYDGPDRFDILPLLVATDGALQVFGRDVRRLRPNLVIGGVAGLEERNWQERRLRIGPVLIQLADLRDRCVMTTFDPDTLEQDPSVLRDIVQRFDGALALNASVLSPGEIAVGARVELVDT